MHGLCAATLLLLGSFPSIARGTPNLTSSTRSIDFGTVLVDSTSPAKKVTLTHAGVPGDPPITIRSVSVTGPFTQTLAPQTLAPGTSVSFQVRFKPTDVGAASGTLTITHDGGNSPLTIALSGAGSHTLPIGFRRSYLQELTATNPTSLQFGPDGKLYIGQADGSIVIATITRDATNVYTAHAKQTIDLVKNIPNHDEKDGALDPAITGRLMTGMLVTGTAAHPVIYATSSDPRVGEPGKPAGFPDSNSGILSRLTWNGSAWVKLDLVRGLPRSLEEHLPNGLALDPTTNTLFVAVGGHTNMGAPSNNFMELPEYALSGAILTVNLTQIGNSTYDLPTLDDEDRPGVNDANDPFGGNGGKNQARIVPGGPVQVYSPGYRNPYDLVRTSSGRMYTIDNGPNAGWGGPPNGEGPAGNCTNAINESGSMTFADQLTLVTRGFYAGHPNPTRASTSNTFNPSNPQSPVPSGDPVECDYRAPGTDGSLAQWPYSTNGICEYRASNLGGALKGNLLAASFGNEVVRFALNARGDSATVTALFSNVGNAPLDVTAQDDAGPFPGTIWVCDYANGLISIYEPSDYDGGMTTCSGVYDHDLDEDNDGYTNADEIDNGTNPCSAADVPPDFDGDFISDRNDPDDDNDGIPDVVDAFARDASNGAQRLPIDWSWDAGHPGTGILGLGFTGLMTDGVTDYLSMYDPRDMTPGGAAGRLTIDHVPAGDARGRLNSQKDAFQVGVATDSTTGPFLARTRITAPYFNDANPVGAESQGFYIGDGGDDDYLKITVANDAGTPAIEVVNEVAGVVSSTMTRVAHLLDAPGITLELDVDPDAGVVQPRFARDGDSLANAGPPIVLAKGSKLRAAVRTSAPLAVGIIATSRGGSPFAATWDFLQVLTPTIASAGRGGFVGARLGPPRPNPSDAAVTCDLALSVAAPVNAAIFDVTGRRVRRLMEEMLPAGTRSLVWNGRDDAGRTVSPGVYLLRVNAGGRRLATEIQRRR